MSELEMALAVLTGAGIPSVEDQFKAAGILDAYGMPITSDTGSYSTGTTTKPGIRSKVDQGAGKVKDALGAALGYADDLVTPAAKRAQLSVLNRLGGVGTGSSGPMASIGRFAASPRALQLAKVGTGIGALGGVLGAADVIAGNDSFANKAMDTAAMGIGGFLGAAGGPMGIAAGAGIGKAVSDGAQFIFGGGKSAEQRKLEEAIMALRGGSL